VLQLSASYSIASCRIPDQSLTTTCCAANAISADLDLVLKRGRAIWCDEVSPKVVPDVYRRSKAPVMASFDLDAFGQSEAPGVSAPAPSGLGAGLWFAAAYEAGRSSVASSADVVQLSPLLDVGDQTARLAALTVW
jgi:arginase family enzyme